MQKICVLCHENTDNQHFCEACLKDLYQLRTPEEVCALCANYSPNKQICQRCLQQENYLDALWASFQYSTPISHLVHRWKYQKQLSLSGSLQSLLLSHPPSWLHAHYFDAILAVPLSRNRLYKRGFNQSDELATAVSKHYKIKLLDVAVKRQHRQAQMKLSRLARLENLNDVFTISKRLDDQRILVIDDVTTTGATLSELAKSLKNSGAQAVCAWVLLHGQINH